ncbi:MAG: App1 family protein [Candidatus Cyclobacteriaceae bacterium M3_2C_046]
MKSIRSILYPLEKAFDTSKIKIKQQFNLFDPIIIYPYHGYANDEKLIVQGRVLEQEGILKDFKEPETTWEKIKYMYRRYESDEIPNIHVMIRIGEYQELVKTDEEGFFHATIDLEKPLKAEDTFWLKVDYKIYNNPYTDQPVITNQGEVLIPGKNSRFVVVSDVDDTIIQSFATNTYLKIKTLVFNKATSRIPFPGVPAFYQALQSQTNHFNPLFFVSGSTWNIYDLLNRFCQHNDIPKAPFFLRQFDLDNDILFLKDTKEFKLKQIYHLMQFYDDLPFIFIGDSGQKDPEIYYQLARKYPERVKAIYIRKIHEKKLSDNRKKMIRELKDLGVDMLFMSNTNQAAEHALDQGLIEGEHIEEIRQKVKEEE